MSELTTLKEFKFDKGAFEGKDGVGNVYLISPERILYVKVKRTTPFIVIENLFLVDKDEWDKASRAFDRWERENRTK